MTKIELYNILIEKHGVPDSIDSLNEYLELILNYNECLTEDSEYYENHHILTQNQFPEYKNSDWNIVKLKYSDHITAHILLFKSFNLRVYQRTLNFMVPNMKCSKLISIAAKRGWVNFKNKTEKYNIWKQMRSEQMKLLTSEERSRRSNLYWDNITTEQYETHCNSSKKYWTSDNKKTKSLNMKQYFLDNPDEMSNRMKLMHSKMSDDDRIKFINKTKEVNSRIEKRNDASIKIRNKWKQPDFIEKMKNRKYKKSCYRLISPEGIEYFIEGFTKMVDQFKFNKTLIRKYKNTGLPVEPPQKQKDKLENINTIGWIIYETISFYKK